MKVLVRKIFERASFHGFPYIVRRDIHWAERILWGAILMLATYYSINICWNQWERYKENPTAYGYKRILGTREFPYMGVTMCSNYFDDHKAEEIIKEIWNTDPNDDKYSYYMRFLHVLATLKYDNFEILEPYKADPSVDNLNFLDILRNLRSTLFSTKTTRGGKPESPGGTLQYGTSSVETNSSITAQPFYSVITEVGMCVSTSFLHEYQNPDGFKREPKKITHQLMCSPFDLCNVQVVPSSIDGNQITAYIHNNEDIVPQDDKEVIHREMTSNEITNVDVDLELLAAENEVRNVAIKYRKCRFPDENNLKYFKIYRPILCRNECRLDAALRLCNCKPFLYVVGPGPICTVQGMLCLVAANWTDTKCSDCLMLCSHNKYTALKTTAHTYGSINFERSLSISFILPKIGVEKRVVFSTDQLVVAFGGSASLFLGCSFLSFAQILYYCMQSLVAKLKRWYSRVK